MVQEFNDYHWRKKVMNTNTYLGLAMAACLIVASSSLLAEVAPATDNAAPETSVTKPLHQKAHKAHKKTSVSAPETSAKDALKEEQETQPLEPSELQRQQMEHNKAITK